MRDLCKSDGGRKSGLSHLEKEKEFAYMLLGLPLTIHVLDFSFEAWSIRLKAATS